MVDEHASLLLLLCNSIDLLLCQNANYIYDRYRSFDTINIMSITRRGRASPYRSPIPEPSVLVINAGMHETTLEVVPSYVRDDMKEAIKSGIAGDYLSWPRIAETCRECDTMQFVRTMLSQVTGDMLYWIYSWWYNLIMYVFAGETSHESTTMNEECPLCFCDLDSTTAPAVLIWFDA